MVSWLGVLDVVGAKFTDVRSADEFHGPLKLVMQEPECLVYSSFATCAEAVKIGTTDHAGSRAHGNRLCNICELTDTGR